MKMQRYKKLYEWQGSLRDNYDNDYNQFLRYDKNYGISQRLGYRSPKEAWFANPKINIGADPSELKVIE